MLTVDVLNRIEHQKLTKDNRNFIFSAVCIVMRARKQK